MNRAGKIRWQIYLPQLLLICLGIIVFFAFCYWILDIFNLGWLLNRANRRESQFLEFLYFSMGTFFRIGYGDQVPVGLSRLIAGVEAFSNYLLEIVFITQLAINFLGKFIPLSIRERLENLYDR